MITMGLLFLFIILLTQRITALIDVDKVINRVNEYRRLHQSPPLVYSAVISEFSQSWADYMASNKLFKHSTDSMYGENLAMTSRIGTDAFIQSIDMFYNEVLLYDYNNPVFNSETGHFTQLVWAETTKIGLGISSSSNGYTYICTNYDPPGNLDREFIANVKPIIQPSVLMNEPSPQYPYPPPPRQLHPHPSPYPVLRSPGKPHPQYPSPPPPRQLHPHPSPYPVLRSPGEPYPTPSSPHPIPASLDHFSSPGPNLHQYPSPYYPSKIYTLSIKYPSTDVKHIDDVLCPAIENIFGGKCTIQLKSSTGIYYGTRTHIDYGVLRKMIAHNLDQFTQSCKIVCGSTIVLHLNGDDLFRYQASRNTCS